MVNHSGIVDSGTHFQIVPSTRRITVPAAYKVIGTVGEHLAEQLTFKVPKLIDGHDIANCARKYVTWKNINDDVGNDELKNMTEDEENLYFTWDVSEGLTAGFGIVSFSVHFEDVDANGKILYRFGTTTCKECEILDTINAILNAYEAVYVAGDTLVFADYNVVKDGTLPLDMDGLIPEGTHVITENGFHDVGRFAQAKVAVNPPTGTKTITQNGTFDVTDYAQAEVALPIEAPQISVSEDGVVKATASGVVSQVQLSSKYDPDFISGNIKKGAKIFGIEGSYDIIPTGTQKITANGLYNVSSVDSVDVAIPFDTPSIDMDPDTGDITASANGKTKTVPGNKLVEYDSDFVSANIRKGVTIFGVEGTLDPSPSLVSGTIVDGWHNNNIDVGVAIYYSGHSWLGEAYGVGYSNYYGIEDGTRFSTKFVKNAPIILMPCLGANIMFTGLQQIGGDVELSGSVELIQKACDGSLFVLKPTGDDFTITLIRKQG